ncbi:MAG: YeeE/YedE family protein [Acidobacteria bacterium]|nr:YeeE/YedE family protein [Acidobacteriota bacterium]
MAKEKIGPLHWAWAGVLLGLLNVVIMNSWVSNRPIGASTAFPYAGGILAGLKDAVYTKLIAKPGLWEIWFLLGAFIGAFVSSMIAGDFKLQLVPERWKAVKGGSPWKRVLWTIIGAFLLIFGARMAGGCTSGHILSGFMQLSAGSMVFGVVVILTFVITGKLFYRS